MYLTILKKSRLSQDLRFLTPEYFMEKLVAADDGTQLFIYFLTKKMGDKIDHSHNKLN